LDVANLQQSQRFNRPPVIGPCLHSISPKRLPCGETIQGGMGDLESRRPSSGGGFFTFGHEYRNELLLSDRLRFPLPAPAEQT
jgi:hypothetical protein